MSFRTLATVAKYGTIYLAAVALLGASDMVLAHHARTRDFGVYQYVRQLIPLLVLAALLGLDQVISRHHAGTAADLVNWASILPRLLTFGSVLSASAAAASLWLMDVPIPAAVALVACPPVLICSELAAGYLRARGRYPMATFVQQGYRLFLGAFVLVTLGFATAIGQYYPLAIPIAALPLAILGVRAMQRAVGALPYANRADVSEMRRVGIFLALAMVTLGALDWVDQASVARRYGSFAASGDYTALKVYFVFPFVAAVSILGFSALPEVAKRRRPPSVREFLILEAFFGLLGLALALGLLTLFAGFPAILPRHSSSGVAMLLVLSGAARLLYVVPSAIVGAFGSKSALAAYAAAGGFALLAEGSTIFVLPWTLDPVAVGAIGLTVGSTLRLLASLALAHSCLGVASPHAITGLNP